MDIHFWRENRTIEKLFLIAGRHKPSNLFIPIGVSEFDKAMDGGLREGELVVISGQTGQGKTLFAQTITCHLNKLDIPNLWFSYEMSPYYLATRFTSMGQTADSPIFSPITLIDGTMKFIEQEIEEAVNEEACKVIFIDHLHYLIPLQESKNSSLLIGGIVRELKKMTIKYAVSIVLIAHTKKIYQGEELDLSSVRDSSLVCQEADYVFLVEREKYIKDEKKKKNQLDCIDYRPYGSDWSNNTKITLAKNRRTGKMPHVQFVYQNGKLISLCDEDYEQ